MRIAPDLTQAIDAARHGEAVMTTCPGHDDGTASLAVRPGDEQPVLLHCHAGCEVVDIIKAAGLEWDEVCRPLDETEQQPVKDGRQPVAFYVYTDELGRSLFRQVRYAPKGFELQRWSNGRWSNGLQDTRRVLYGLPRVIDAVNHGVTVWLVEGEKDAQRALADGLVATTNPMGAGNGKWLPEFTTVLAGADIVLVEDADKPGREHGDRVKAALVAAGCRVRVMETSIPGCKDYSDHRDHGGTHETLTTLWDSKAHRPITEPWTVEELVERPRERTREVIPRMLAQRNVVLIVGPEGHGKSLMLRQIAMQCACGMTPFTLAPMEPLDVLVVDAENDDVEDEWESLLGVAAYHRGRPEGRLHIVQSNGTEVNLLSEVGQSFLMGWIERCHPAVVCLGPVYKLVHKDVKDDDAVRELERCITRASGICGSAFIIEHHAPHRGPIDTRRVMRPYGSSVFLRWPDFGFGLTPTDDEAVYDLHRFRGARKRTRVWPERVRQGVPNTAEFPWEDAGPVDGGRVVPMRRQ